MKGNRRKALKEYQCKWHSPLNNDLSPGQLVKSIQGRDRDAWYLVLRVEDNLVWVVEGRRRGIENPKRKNRLHLQATGKIAADFAQSLAEGKSIRNEEIRENLTGFLKRPQG